jgi:hypothetical protein
VDTTPDRPCRNRTILRRRYERTALVVLRPDMSNTTSRQSFLGDNSDDDLRTVAAGIVGLGGGGSHIVQQLAHIGVGRFHVFDSQTIEDTNLNRLVGATRRHVEARTPKTEIARRLIKSIRPGAEVHVHSVPWQSAANALRECDVVFGCVDSFAGRNELERQLRRYLTPYIDIGMDVHAVGDEFMVSGQVVLSLPGRPCLWCCGVLTEARIAEEAADYGAAGPRQQVIWPNGVLASTAVGQFVRLVTPWTSSPPACLLEYNGNRGTVSISNKTPFLPELCGHFDGQHDVGDPLLRMK